MRFDGTSGQRYGELLHQIERLKMRVCGLEIENESLKKVTAEWEEMHQKDEAVIAGVKDWRSRHSWANEAYYMDELDAILSSQPEVLAVVEGHVQVGSDTVHTFVEDLRELGDGYTGKPPYRPVTVIVVKGGQK